MSLKILPKPYGKGWKASLPNVLSAPLALSSSRRPCCGWARPPPSHFEEQVVCAQQRQGTQAAAMPTPKTIEAIYEDYKLRREGLLLALVDGKPARGPPAVEARWPAGHDS